MLEWDVSTRGAVRLRECALEPGCGGRWRCLFDNGKGVLLCPLEGCTTTPKQLASRGAHYIAAVNSGGIALVNLYGGVL